MKTRPYVVRQGDYVARLAHTMRFDAGEVWQDESNRRLRERRGSPNILAPGDVLRVPTEPKVRPLPLNVGGRSTFKGRAPRVTVTVAVHDKGEPLKDAPFVIDGLGKRIEGRSDGDGKITFEAPIHVREARVTFYEVHLVFIVRIGDLDPVDEDSGVRQRLAHLGFDGWALGEAAGLPRPPSESGDADAIRAFQRASGLEDTGVADEATRDALRKAHGG